MRTHQNKNDRINHFSRVIFVALLCSSLSSIASAQVTTVNELQAKGAFGFPAQSAQTLCDTEELRVQVKCDSEQFLLQAILWEDSSDELGETDDGRPVGDSSSVVFDADFDHKMTPELDRTYLLNPWPVMPGLHYTIPYKQGTSHIQRDSAGSGAIRFLEVDGDRKVRVDTYLVPLSEIQAKADGTIGVAFLGRSTTPELVVNSIGYQSKRPSYYAFELPFKNFSEVKLTPSDQPLDVSEIPNGRKDEKRAKKPKVQSLLKVGEVPPALQAKGWLGAEERPSFEKLNGKVVLIDFWATWCGPCVAGIPHLNELQAKHKDEGLVVLGVTDQSRKGIAAFQEKVPMDYPVGVGSELGAAFGAQALPHAFIIGRDGKLFWEGLPSDDDFGSKLTAALDASAVEPVPLPVETKPAQTKPASETGASIHLEPGSSFEIDFPVLEKTWRDVPAKAGVYLPSDYDVDRKFPLFVWFAGGAGSDNTAKAVAITGGEGFVCVALPYRTDADGEPGGWQTPWSYYKTMLDKVESLIPNLDADRRVCGGFSSGGAAIMHQIGNSDHAFQHYFYAFIPGGAGWPMGELESIQGRPMLALMGENDKRLPNFQKLEEAATAAGIDFTFLKIADTGHKFPESTHAEVKEWMISHVVQRQVDLSNSDAN